jgi:hypothetical protein
MKSAERIMKSGLATPNFASVASDLQSLLNYESLNFEILK